MSLKKKKIYIAAIRNNNKNTSGTNIRYTRRAFYESRKPSIVVAIFRGVKFIIKYNISFRRLDFDVGNTRTYNNII